MAVTSKPKTRDSQITIRLRNPVFDQLCQQRGATTEMAKAALVGTPRETVYWIRHGRTPSSQLMLRWARALGVSVEHLWQVTDD